MKRDKQNIAEYQPFPGFEDLREYDLKADVFIKFWNVQQFLYYTEQNEKEKIKKNEENPGHNIHQHPQWEKVQEVSALYQQELLRYRKEAELKSCIRIAKSNWVDVTDVDKWLSELRGD